MSMQDAIASVFRNYATFNGRARRSEFWYFALFQVLVAVATTLIDKALGGSIISLIGTIALFLPGLAVSVRRLHDLDKTGWWYLIAFLPIIGGLVLLFWFCGEGTNGDNRFGQDPKKAYALAV